MCNLAAYHYREFYIENLVSAPTIYIKTPNINVPMISTRVWAVMQKTALDPVSIGKVKTLLNQRDITKATSHEDSPTWLSKEGREDICVPVHEIIISTLNSGQYQNFYNRAQITPLPKVSHPKLYKDPSSVLTFSYW